MSKYWNHTTRSLTPYVPGEQPRNHRYIKLNTNENPYPPSPSVINAISCAVNEELRLYPDPNCRELIEAIAKARKVRPDHVFVGNGSDEILAFAFQAFFDEARPVCFPDITYSFYPVYAELYKVPYTLIPLNEDFSIPVTVFAAQNSSIIIANPNAPTALALSTEDIRILLSANTEHIVIVDEAYIDFAGESSVSLVDEFPNLLVIHTLSKSYALAGLRVGYAIGNPELIEGLNRIKNSFNSYTLDRLALAGAQAAINDEDYFKQTVSRIIHTRNETIRKLTAMNFYVTDSKSNFIFISHPAVEAKYIFEQLRHAGILVRHFDRPKIDNFLRISIGTDEEMEAVVQQLCSIIFEDREER